MEEQKPETENVREQPSLFSYLHDLRIERGIERDRLATALGIPEHLIEAVESDDRKRLPSDAYILGIARKYAGYFKIPYEKMEELWRAEISHAVSGRRDFLPQNRFVSPRRSWSVRLSAGIVFFVFVFGYLGLQFFSAVMPVRIRVEELPTVSQKSPLRVSGMLTGRPKTLFLNGRQIRLAGNRFSADVWLVPGPNSIRIVAENYVGASSTAERIVVYQE